MKYLIILLLSLQQLIYPQPEVILGSRCPTECNQNNGCAPLCYNNTFIKGKMNCYTTEKDETSQECKYFPPVPQQKIVEELSEEGSRKRKRAHKNSYDPSCPKGMKPKLMFNKMTCMCEQYEGTYNEFTGGCE